MKRDIRGHPSGLARWSNRRERRTHVVVLDRIRTDVVDEKVIASNRVRSPMEAMRDEGSNGRRAALSEFEAGITMEEALWREADWGEMRVGYETYLKDFDDALLLKGLPNDRCQCPHWGYLLSGRMTVRYADHDEIVEAGDVYYMAPDHTIAVDAGTVLIEFSPKEEFRKTVDVGERNLAKLEDVRIDTA